MKNKDKFIVYDPIDNFVYRFENEVDAEKKLSELLEECCDDGVPEEVVDGEFFIAKVIKKNAYKVTHIKSDYTDKEWSEDLCFSPDFETMGKVFVENVENNS